MQENLQATGMDQTPETKKKQITMKPGTCSDITAIPTIPGILGRRLLGISSLYFAPYL